MYFDYQYELIKSSRGVLLDYCSTIAEKHFVAENSSFGKGSIRNLLVHIGNTYEFWIGKHALNKIVSFQPYASIGNSFEAVAYFRTIDELIEEFLVRYAEAPLSVMHITLDDKTISVTPLQLFTHVVTHEFHHKGQILSLSRQLGYVPVDTDIIR